MTAAAAGPAACSCELGRARRHLERAVAELEQARLAWGVWADSVRKLAEQRWSTPALVKVTSVIRGLAFPHATHAIQIIRRRKVKGK